VKLRELAKVIRTKNAGARLLTIDVMFDDAAPYDLVKASGVLSRELFARLYRAPLERVSVIDYPPAMAIKCTLPRLVQAGDPGDSDVYGCQQHGPLMDLDVPD
jgi:uncharacterized protein DUF4387